MQGVDIKISGKKRFLNYSVKCNKIALQYSFVPRYLRVKAEKCNCFYEFLHI